MNKRKIRQGRYEFTLRLVAMKNEAARLGLWKTMHGIDVATNAIGWEIAELQQNPKIEFRGLN